jgi:uncharacterized membrane protein YdjX (TVP38/TMEM64 family)
LFIGAIVVSFTPAASGFARYLRDFLEVVRELGAWGPLVLGSAYSAATLLLLPGSPFTLAAGFLLGPVLGSITSSLAGVVGAGLAFLIGRLFLRDQLQQQTENNEDFKNLDEAIAKNGFTIVLLSRLSPVFPFNISNYVLSLTNVRFASYLLATWLGMLPGTVLFVYVGSTLGSLTQIVAGDLEFETGHYVVLAAGILATIAATILMTRLAGAALEKRVPRSRARDAVR